MHCWFWTRIAFQSLKETGGDSCLGETCIERLSALFSVSQAVCSQLKEKSLETNYLAKV